MHTLIELFSFRVEIPVTLTVSAYVTAAGDKSAIDASREAFGLRHLTAPVSSELVGERLAFRLVLVVGENAFVVKRLQLA